MPTIYNCKYARFSGWVSQSGYMHCQWHFDGCCQHPDVPIEVAHNRPAEECRVHTDNI